MTAADHRRARGRAPMPESFAGQEALIAVNMVLAAELSVVRERLDTVERLLASARLLDPAAIDGFVPDAAASTERDRLRQRLIARVFGVFKRDGHARVQRVAEAALAAAAEGGTGEAAATRP